MKMKPAQKFPSIVVLNFPLNKVIHFSLHRNACKVHKSMKNQTNCNKPWQLYCVNSLLRAWVYQRDKVRKI